MWRLASEPTAVMPLAGPGHGDAPAGGGALPAEAQDDPGLSRPALGGGEDSAGCKRRPAGLPAGTLEWRKRASGTRTPAPSCRSLAEAIHEEGLAVVGKRFPKHLTETYDIDSMLGQGAFSTVWRCVHRASGQIRAVKKIDTTELSPREIAHEIALMRLLRHENVVRCYDVFLEAQFVNIVVDMFSGGDLVDGLNAHRRVRGRVQDAQLANLTRQMIAAVAHVHSLQIVHRDVKGENFLSDRPDIGDPGCRVALADFGTAERIEPGEKLSARVGTVAFWAPEVWACRYDFLVDVWAVGITTFILLSGSLPFEGEEEVCRPLGLGELPFKAPYFATRACTDFIACCLAKDPEERPAAAEAARHPWMTTPPTRSSSKLSFLQGPEAAEFGEKASAVLLVLADVLGALVVGVCQSLGCCLDIVFGPLEASASSPSLRRSTSSASPLLPRREPAQSSSAELGGADPVSLVRKADIEKQVTELTSRITRNVSQATG